ncbi:hypothetical protein XELAEV_18018899mg, partial [Xenopus laevis]
KSCCDTYWKEFDKSCYYFEVSQMNWIDARLFCKRINSDLVIVNSEEEQQYLQHITGGVFYWIGLQRLNNTWTWVDGSIIKESSGFWRENEPNNKGGKENCVALTFKGEWNDAPCVNREYQPICEI